MNPKICKNCSRCELTFYVMDNSMSFDKKPYYAYTFENNTKRFNYNIYRVIERYRLIKGKWKQIDNFQIPVFTEKPLPKWKKFFKKRFIEKYLEKTKAFEDCYYRLEHEIYDANKLSGEKS